MRAVCVGRPAAAAARDRASLWWPTRAMRHTIAQRDFRRGGVCRGDRRRIDDLDRPVHLILCVCERLYHDRYNQPDKLAITGGEETDWPVPYSLQSCRFMLVLMTAIAEGLAATFFGDPTRRQSCELLDLPTDVVPIGVALHGLPSRGTRTQNGRHARSRSSSVPKRRSSTASAGALARLRSVLPSRYRNPPDGRLRREAVSRLSRRPHKGRVPLEGKSRREPRPRRLPRQRQSAGTAAPPGLETDRARLRARAPRPPRRLVVRRLPVGAQRRSDANKRLPVGTTSCWRSSTG